MEGKKTYQIVINGVQESIDAVKALNEQLTALEEKIKSVEQKTIKVVTSGTSTSTTSPSKTVERQLNEQDRLEKKILETEKKLADVRDENYKKLLHMKEELREYTQIAKSQVAAEENAQGINPANTMLGLKNQLRSIKQEMQTVDIGGDRFQTLVQQANELNAKLKEIETSYGQYGRNVGNYTNSIVDAMGKIKVTVGDTVREYDNYRQAVKALKEERFALSQSLGQEADEYKKIDVALKTLESDYKDLNVSSRFMDNMLDTMQGFMALASIGQGLSMFFDIDDSDFQKSMQKFAALSLTLQGLETLMKQIQTQQGILGKGWAKLGEAATNAGKKISQYFFGRSMEKEFGRMDEELAHITKGWLHYLSLKDDDPYKKHLAGEVMAEEVAYAKKLGMSLQEVDDKVAKVVDNFTNGMKRVARISKIVGKAIASAFTLGLMYILPDILEGIESFVKGLFSTKTAAESAEKSINALNRALKTKMDLLSSQYLRREISDEQYLNGVYQTQTESIVKQIDALQKRAAAMRETFGANGANDRFFNIDKFFSSTKNIEFTGEKFSGEKTVGHGRATSGWFITKYMNNDLEITVKDIKEVEEAWRQCNEAINEGKDYFDKWGKGFSGWFQSLFVTLKDTEEVMRGMGNIKLSDTIADFQRVNDQFNRGEISAEQFQKELARLRNEMNNNEILQSVIANLDKYIPDEKVRTAVQNIINEIYRLDDAFNMTSPEQIHYWNQVRIDGMADGIKKTKAQIAENERYEIQQYGHTQEQIDLLHKKYNRQRIEAQERYNKKSQKSAKSHGKSLADIENELIALRIENMRNGEEKALKQIENERRLALQKAREYGKKAGEISIEINKKYDLKILEEKRKWAFDMLKTYEDLAARIEQINRSTFEMETETATNKTRSKASDKRLDEGYSAITPTTFDDTEVLDEYYKKVLEIETKAANTEAAIRQESLDRMIDYEKAEEELRHKRLLDVNGGEYIQQLRAGLITQEEYDELVEKEKDAHNARMNALDRQYESETKLSQEQNLEAIYNLYNKYFGNVVSLASENMAKITEQLEKQPKVDTMGWGIVNIKETSKAYKKALGDFETLKQGIINKQAELEEALKKKRISPEDFAMRQSELKQALKNIDNAVNDVKQKQKDLFENFMQSIQQYLQAGFQALNSILSSLSDIQSNHYDKMIDEQEKYIEKLQEMYDKQQEITQQHASEVESIEDELSDARGDRRQQLIDQLNAEMAAQRASLAQEKKIEKEREKADKKRADLEYKQALEKKKMQEAQAIINGLMAVSMAAVNSWPIPAIPMMALAAATTAAQYAAIKSQYIPKPSYGDGGVIVGKSHKEGGVQVLGGRAEVEGGEFITNKVTTAKNVDLLEYINTKKRKLNLDDLIEFYGSNSVKKNIKAVRTKFADGGTIPMLRADITSNDRLIRSFEDYANRPSVVQVVDIIDRTAAVNNVKVLAGLEV